MNLSPIKTKTPAKKSGKKMKMDHNLFRSVHHFGRYRDSFMRGTIIQDRFVDLGDLKDAFILGCFEGLEDHDFTNYKDKILSIETVQTHIGGQREERCLNTIAFPAGMRCLTTIMMFNLYPMRKLTTINNARAIFLMELKEKTFIGISSHILDTIVDETRTTSRPKLIFPSLLMRLFKAKGVVIPQDISPMPTPSAINKLTIIRI